MKTTVLAWIAVIVIGACISGPVGSQSNYDQCILKYMKDAIAETAAQEIRNACNNLFNWHYHETRTCYSPRTDNNHEVRYRDNCDRRSDQGKGRYCADQVEMSCSLMDDEIYEYRYVDSRGSCPKIRVSDGPNGWYDFLGCQFSVDRKRFTAQIAGWTWPQVFTTSLRVDRRRLNPTLPNGCQTSSAECKQVQGD